MKHLLSTTLVCVLAISFSFSQTPQSFKYQAIAWDDMGNVIADQDIGLKISILKGSVSGSVVYSETHLAHTNQFGLFNIGIGSGSVLSGIFTCISWGANIFFIKTNTSLLTTLTTFSPINLFGKNSIDNICNI